MSYEWARRQVSHQWQRRTKTSATYDLGYNGYLNNLHLLCVQFLIDVGESDLLSCSNAIRLMITQVAYLM